MELAPGCMVHQDRIQTQARLLRAAGLPLGRPVPALGQHALQQVRARIPHRTPDLEVARSSAFHPTSLQHAG